MTTPTAAILGIDLGTTEVKVGLVGLDGRLLAMARGAYALDVGPDGRAEQDPGAWWSAIGVAVHALRPADAVDVVAIGVDGHGPTLVAVDRDGNIYVGELSGRSWDRFAAGPVPAKRRVIHRLEKVAA